MKKKVVEYIVLGMLLSMLTGCGKVQVQQPSADEEEKQMETVALTVWGGESDQELLTEMVESFQKEYEAEAQFEIIVEVESEASCKERLLGDVYEGADVFAFADDQLMEMAASGVLEKIDYAEQVGEANTEGSVYAASINGDLYAYPMTADNGYFMFYNKAFFTDEDVKTWDRMLEIAAESGKKVTMELTSGWYLYSFFGGAGLSLTLNEDGVTNSCDWNTTEGSITGADVAEAILEIAANKGFASVTDADFVAGIQDGSIIAGINGVWNAAVIRETWGEDYGAVKLPSYACNGEQVQMSSFAGYKMVGVNAYSKEKEWAEKLAEWLTNEENQTIRFVKREQGPSNIKAGDSEEVAASPAIQALIEQSAYASLQRIGAKYWTPVETFGGIMVQGNADGIELQELLDNLVRGITASVTE